MKKTLFLLLLTLISTSVFAMQINNIDKVIKTRDVVTKSLLRRFGSSIARNKTLTLSTAIIMALVIDSTLDEIPLCIAEWIRNLNGTEIIKIIEEAEDFF